MHIAKRLTKALALTLRDQLLDVSGALVIPGLKRVIHSSLPPKMHPGRMLTHRLLSSRSIDGAILSGLAPADAWAKFTLPKGLPRDGQKFLAIENEPHTIDDFDGVIEAGYGKGTKTLLCSDNGIVKVGKASFPGRFNLHFHEAEVAGPHYDLVVEGVPSGTRNWELHIPRGEYKGRYAFHTTAKGSVIVVPMVDQGITHPKPAYSLKDQAFLDKIAATPEDWVIEQKIDGSLGNAVIKDNRVSFRSHRDTGETYYDRLPQLEHIENSSRAWSCRWLFPGPKQSGTVLKGELYHPDGAARMGGILNSLPDKARQIQALRGPATYWAWDILKLRGRDVSAKPVAERRILLEQVIREIRLFNKHWNIVPKCQPDQDPREFYAQVVAHPLPFGEGIVVKRSTEAHGAGTWLKLKQTDFEDLEVVDILEGNGKYAHSAGKLVVRVPGSDVRHNGELGEVGSFAVTDDQRQWIWEHKELLKGSIAKVRVQELTERGVPRAGVFMAWHEGKGPTNAGLLMYSESLAGGDQEDMMDIKYALISANGWRR
jgi:hypothetical protein